MHFKKIMQGSGGAYLLSSTQEEGAGPGAGAGAGTETTK